MGAWGTGIFENDDAVDWVTELEHSDGLNAITDALAFVANLDLDEYLEAPDAAQSLAAAEVVAALHGYPSGALPPGVQAWLASNGSLALRDPIALAIKAVSRVKSDSELKELWDEEGKAAEWQAGLDGLLERLRRSEKE